MLAIWQSPTWYFRGLRIGLLALLGWWLLRLCCLPSHAALPWEEEWPDTDFSRHTVPLNEIDSGGPPKDGIPAIDAPRFVTPAAAKRWLAAREPVILLQLHGQARAYPLQILLYHEIVNDRIADTPVAITFCPLCNASLVFERRVAGQMLDFGTTGKLRNSDLVMYDRQTESWWQQFSGRAIVGSMAGQQLKRVPSAIVAFADFAAAHPAGRVLSRRTGFTRSYGRNPYPGYDSVDQPWLFAQRPDKRLRPMERVLAVEQAGRQRIYPLTLFAQRRVLADQLADLPIVIFATPGLLSALDAGRIRDSHSTVQAAAFERRARGQELDFEWTGTTYRDRQTGSHWNALGQAQQGPLKGSQLRLLSGGAHFAFAWLAFNPDSEIYAAP